MPGITSRPEGRLSLAFRSRRSRPLASLTLDRQVMRRVWFWLSESSERLTVASVRLQPEVLVP